MDNQRVYGIDLGTTYSCIAYVDEHGKPVVVNNNDNESTTPSVVYFESPTNISVGSHAKEQAVIEPDRCVSTVKRAMGDAHWKRTFFDKTYTPPEVSALILRKLVNDAQQNTGDTIKDVVITCPAYFGFNEKEATRQAGEIAGLNVEYVIPEPTAAALAYGVGQQEDQVVLVYDLGGGTFDITVIEIKGGDLTVICTDGDHKLGGKDWDEAIISHFVHAFEEETGVPCDDLYEDLDTYAELVSQAESCKRALTSRESMTQVIRHDGRRAKVELTREEFDRMTADLLGRTLDLTDQVLAKARDKGISSIDKLLLVGGSTYMCQVRDAVEQRFSMEVVQFDPNQAVAKGAAVFGHKYSLEKRIKSEIVGRLGDSGAPIELADVSPEVLDQAVDKVAEEHGMDADQVKERVNQEVINISSKSLGITALDSEGKEKVFQLVKVDDRVPVEVTQEFATVSDGQRQVDVRCRESTRAESQVEVEATKEIGEAVLEFNEPVAASSPVLITFKLRPDGLLEVEGRDLTTGGEMSASFETEAVLSQEVVEEARVHVAALQIA